MDNASGYSYPVEWQVHRWSEDPFSQGSWSQIKVGGSPIDRNILGRPLSQSFAIAGEACDEEMPAMVNGAYNSGLKAAKSMLDCESLCKDSSVVIIGAGAAGIAAANLAIKLGFRNVLILESRDRIGGRIHTVDLMNAEVKVDAGATWLQQVEYNNILFPIARDLGLHVFKTDFNNPLCASKHGLEDYHRIMKCMDVISQEATNMTIDNDISLSEVIKRVSNNCISTAETQGIDVVVADIMTDSGADPSILSAKYCFIEPGVGNGDYYIKEGYGALISKLADGLNILVGHKVIELDWGGRHSNSVKITTANGKVFVADRCICTVPISILKDESTLRLIPPWPPEYQSALSHLTMGFCDKVILRFSNRWWPRHPGGVFRWYGGGAGGLGNKNEAQQSRVTAGDDHGKYGRTWVDWVDLTEGVGVPLVVGFLTGEDAIQSCERGRTDEEVAMAATDALMEWSRCVQKTSPASSHGDDICNPRKSDLTDEHVPPCEEAFKIVSVAADSDLHGNAVPIEEGKIEANYGTFSSAGEPTSGTPIDYDIAGEQRSSVKLREPVHVIINKCAISMRTNPHMKDQYLVRPLHAHIQGGSMVAILGGSGQL